MEFEGVIGQALDEGVTPEGFEQLPEDRRIFAGALQRVGQFAAELGAAEDEDLDRDGVGGQEGGGVEELEGSGGFSLDGLDADAPRCGDGLLIVVGRKLGEQLHATALEAGEVVGERDSHGIHVGRRLLEGERQVTQPRSQRGGRLGLVALGALGQEAHRFAWLHRPQARRAPDPDRLERPRPRRQQDSAALPPGWQVVAQQGGVVGIVEDQQPAVFPRQPGLHRRDHRLELGLVPRQLQPPGDPGVGGAEGRLGLGCHPQDVAILLLEAVRVLDRCLRLADPAQAVDGRLSEGGRPFRLELLMEPL